MDKIKFYITNRFLLLLASVFIFVAIHYGYTGMLLPTTDTKNLWFYSGLFMVFFSILFIEPYYSSPKNVLTNTIPLLLVLIAIKQSFKSQVLWLCLMGLVAGLMVLSILVIALSSKNESSDSFRNSLSEKLRFFAVTFGQGKVLYSTTFISIIFLYQIEIVESFSESYLLTMVVLWGLVLLINPKKLHNQFSRSNRDNDSDAIGEIFSIQSNNIFLVRLFSDKKRISKFDLVRFCYSLNKQEHFYYAFVFDTYNLNHERWVKILPLRQERKNGIKLKPDTIYKLSDAAEIGKITEELNIDRFVGVVTEGSKIGKIFFDYSKKTNDIQEGDLLEAQIGSNRVFYQVMDGLTSTENLENKNKSGSVQGEAIQLGIWNNESISFEKFGWLPEINTPLFRANTENISVKEFKLPEYKLGIIPGTNLPSVINLDEAVSHHTALLGVTGAGKSFLALELIKQIEINTKVICIDFTGEWKKKKTMVSLNKDNIHSFLSSDMDSVGIIELPEVSNTVKVIESTEEVISQIFNIAKKHYDSDKPIKVCLILEEAHTIVPEGKFLGVNDWDSKAVVNKIGQVALQGRKYGVGLMVIAQRTANVSKTVLTQCNTIVCFQAFDETSFNFLGNYIGKDLVQSLPNLKKYHAIVTGKAVKSNIPMIINLKRDISEDKGTQE